MVEIIWHIQHIGINLISYQHKMWTIYIKARSFQEAKDKLAKEFWLEWEPVRLTDTNFYKFVNPKYKKSIENELPINKVMKKYKETFKY